MLYPKIELKKNRNIAINILLGLSIIFVLVCILINFLIKTEILWSAIVVIGMVYVWVTTLYAVYRSANIAFHVMLQMISVSLLLIILDNIVGYTKWSLEIGVPIIIMISNITMLVITIVSRKQYIKYAIYHIIILIFSMFPIVFLLFSAGQIGMLNIISTSIAIGIFIISLFLAGKSIIQDIKMRLHI